MMTGFLHEKEFSPHESFLKGGGALIVGFSVVASAGLVSKSAKRRSEPVREQRAV